MYNGRTVNPLCLSRSLLLLPGHDEASVQILLNPDDPQHIPSAIELLEAVVALRTGREASWASGGCFPWKGGLCAVVKICDQPRGWAIEVDSGPSTRTTTFGVVRLQMVRSR
ncbi:hypothetical protein B0H14DRAFT_2567354 [Mycena olivaceomarginata]|nr:hypothetical protein B0H14DRAFT_2567354 [Mycena olivaceomarginata]